MRDDSAEVHPRRKSTPSTSGARLRAVRILTAVLGIAAASSACNCGGAMLGVAAAPDAAPEEPSARLDAGVLAQPEPQGRAAVDGAAGDDATDAESEADGGLVFDAGSSFDPPDSGGCTEQGTISGRVCAPAARDWVAGATVQLEAVDCHGNRITRAAVTGGDGAFEVDDVPPGQWTVSAIAGRFSRTYTVEVRSGARTIIPEDQLCVAQNVRIAVITGAGDQIETLLGALGLSFDTYDGHRGYATEAGPLLADLARLEQYDLVFIDCGAASARGQIDLGPGADTIARNLAAYVQHGGSVYASDWAVTFLALAFPQQIAPRSSTGAAVASPFVPNQFTGYAPQEVQARVVDAALASALRSNQVSITFPSEQGARSNHWGLLGPAPSNARVLVEGTVAMCASSGHTCDEREGPGDVVTAPLALGFKLTPIDQRGGNVFYTSFHNIAQRGQDVANILKYIVFHL